MDWKLCSPTRSIQWANPIAVGRSKPKRRWPNRKSTMPRGFGVEDPKATVAKVRSWLKYLNPQIAVHYVDEGVEVLGSGR